MRRLFFNVGREHGIAPGDIVGVIAGVVRIPKENVGAIHILPRRTAVDVLQKHARQICEKLDGIKFKGRKLSVTPGKP